MLRVIFCLICLWLPSYGRAQCLTISGHIADAQSGKLISQARIVQKTKSISQTLFETSMDGLYHISVSCNLAAISVEAKGYLSQKIPLNLIQNAVNGHFFVPVNLVAIDKQTSDKPYLQTEQQHVTLHENNRSGKTGSTRLFETIDALSGKRIDAELCLFYTKTGRKDCQKIEAELGYEIRFDQTDIVAIEVRAQGYQSYFGNLILEKMDGKKSTYQIGLSSEINMLTVTINNFPENVTCQLTAEKPAHFVSQDNAHFYAYVSPNKTYNLVVAGNDGNVLFSKPVKVAEGINFYSLDLAKQHNVSTSAAGAPFAMLQGDNRILYFNKSDYILHKKNRLTLDSLAAWMLLNPYGILKLTGHTDNVGPADRNDILSEYRAKVTYNYLIQKGIDSDRISYSGSGSRQPGAPNDVESNRERNRRVEIQVIKKPGL